MSWLSNAWRNLFHRAHVEREIDDEMRAAYEQLVDEKVHAGMGRDEARRAAGIELGGVESVKEQIRQARAGAGVETVVQDVRYALRLLRRSPLFTLTATLSIAIGIGADTTVFTIANALLFRPPAGVSEPGRLVDIGRTTAGRGALRANFGDVSYPNYLDIRARATTLTDVYGSPLVPEAMSLGGAAGAERISVSYVTSNYFGALGARPAMGRFFGPESDRPGSSVVVLGHAFWARRFNRDRSLVGRSLELNGHTFQVIGVSAEGFRGTNVLVADVWLPTGAVALLKGGDFYSSYRDRGWLMLGGRLKPGFSVMQASAELDAIGRELEREYPAANRGQGLRAAASAPVPGGLVPIAAGFIALLMGLVSLVLIIACANLAGVLLARATTRRREIAVRMAIGADRLRLVRQLLTETVMLFLLGGAVGLLLARWMTSVVVSLLPVLPVPVDVSLPLDGRVVAFTAGLSLLASVICGLMPALHASKADVASTLKADSQAPGARFRLRNAFVVVQVAFSVVLVVCAGLLGRGLLRASSLDLGFDPRGIELATLDLNLAGYTDATATPFVRELVERLRQIPGVQAATAAATTPMGDLVFRLDRITVPGATPANGRPFFDARWNIVEPGYFETLRIPVARGRDFGPSDRTGGAPVALVSETAARAFWPGQDAIGKAFQLHGTGTSMMSRLDTDPNAVRRVTIIGVVRDVKLGLSDDAVPPMVYLPLQQQYVPRLRVTLAARTDGGQRVAGEVRALVTSMNPKLPVVVAQTLENQIALGTTRQRIAASMTGSLGLVGLLLAALGLYGVTTYVVTCRTREIGIRLALGAQRRDLIVMVLREGLWLTLTGATTGLVISVGAARLLASLLFGLPPVDPVTFGGAAVLFVVIAVAACYVPVRRAIGIPAMDAIRHE